MNGQPRLPDVTAKEDSGVCKSSSTVGGGGPPTNPWQAPPFGGKHTRTVTGHGAANYIFQP